MTEGDSSPRVYAGALPFELTEGDIICVFSQFGEVAEINLARDKDTGKSRGFCFLKYEDKRSCELAVDNLNGTTIVGRKIKVSFANNTGAVKSKRAINVAPTEDGPAILQFDHFEEKSERLLPIEFTKKDGDETELVRSRYRGQEETRSERSRRDGDRYGSDDRGRHHEVRDSYSSHHNRHRHSDHHHDSYERKRSYENQGELYRRDRSPDRTKRHRHSDSRRRRSSSEYSDRSDRGGHSRNHSSDRRHRRSRSRSPSRYRHERKYSPSRDRHHRSEQKDRTSPRHRRSSPSRHY